MKYCCVPLCTSRSGVSGKEKISFHTIPSNFEQRNKWLKIISREGRMCLNSRQPSVHLHVCHKHFTASDFSISTTTRRLLPNTVPSIFETYPAYKLPVPSKKRKKTIPEKEDIPVKKLCIKKVTPEVLETVADNDEWNQQLSETVSDNNEWNQQVSKTVPDNDEWNQQRTVQSHMRKLKSTTTMKILLRLKKFSKKKVPSKKRKELTPVNEIPVKKLCIKKEMPEVSETVSDNDEWNQQVSETVSDNNEWKQQAAETVSDNDEWNQPVFETVSENNEWNQQVTETVSDNDEWNQQVAETVSDNDKRNQQNAVQSHVCELKSTTTTMKIFSRLYEQIRSLKKSNLRLRNKIKVLNCEIANLKSEKRKERFEK